MANKKKNNKSKINIYWFYASIVFFILSIGLLGGDNGIQNIQQTNISSFENYLRNGDIEKVAIINQRYARITLNENALEKDIHRGVKSKNFLGQENISGPHYQFEIGTPELFERKLQEIRETEDLTFSTEFITMENRWLDVLLGFLPIIIIIGVVIFQSVFIVQEISQAIVLQFGDPKKIITKAGLNFKLPFIQNVVYLDKRILNLDSAPEEVIAADQKRLIVDAIARFKIVDPLKFYISVGNERVARSRLSTIINSRIRGVLGTQELATLLSTDRAKQMSIIQNDVNTEAENFGIQIVDVRIKRADLPPANSEAIYSRMQTERQREAKEFRAQGAEIAQKIRSTADKDVTVILANANKKSEIMKGEGDGKRNNIFANAFGRDPQFFAFYRAMQAYEKALIGGETSLVLSPDSEFFKFFGKSAGTAIKKR